MAHDYKKRRKSSRTAQPTSGGLVWFAAGVLVGTFLTGLAWLKLSPLESSVSGSVVAQTEHPAGSPKAAQPDEKSAPPPVTQHTSRFHFFDDLPKQEVKVTEKPLALRDTEKSADKNKVYYLQIASFRRLPEAERLRAELAFAGIETKINEATLDQLSHYRVMAGPFNDRAATRQVEQQLSQQGHQQLWIVQADQ